MGRGGNGHDGGGGIVGGWRAGGEGNRAGMIVSPILLLIVRIYLFADVGSALGLMSMLIYDSQAVPCHPSPNLRSAPPPPSASPTWGGEEMGTTRGLI